MSKHKSNKRKIYVAEFSGSGTVLISKCFSEEEMRERVMNKVNEIPLCAARHEYVKIKEIKHSENEIFFLNGDY